MRKIPRVSIGVAVYNGERFLGETLESIKAQTFTDFEVIISDNASTDRTAEICRQYMEGDPRFRYHRNPKNLGFAPNYNLVFQLSSGEFFKWADYDDLLEPNFLERTVEVLDRHPEVVLCYPKVNIIDEFGAAQGAHDPGPDATMADPAARFENLILRAQYAIQTMGLMRRSAILQTALHGSYPSSDEIFLAEMALEGPFFELSDRLLKVRLHPQQSTRGAQASQRSRVAFFNSALKGKIVLPKWQYLAASVDAVRHAPIDRPAKLHCYVTVLRWTLIPHNFRAMGKDVLLAGAKAVNQLPLSPSRIYAHGQEQR